MKFKGRVHCRSSFSVLNEGVELSIKQFLLFFRTPPSLRKKPSKIRSCTPSQQIMELEEACSLIAMDMEELFSQFAMQMKNLTRSLLCTLLVVYSWIGTIQLVVLHSLHKLRVKFFHFHYKLRAKFFYYITNNEANPSISIRIYE